MRAMCLLNVDICSTLRSMNSAGIGYLQNASVLITTAPNVLSSQLWGTGRLPWVFRTIMAAKPKVLLAAG